MLSVLSLPPGIFWYCITGKHFKSVIVFLSCLFAVLSFFQPRFFIEDKENADQAAKCTVVGPGDVKTRDVADVNRFREALNLKEIFA